MSRRLAQFADVQLGYSIKQLRRERRVQQACRQYFVTSLIGGPGAVQRQETLLIDAYTDADLDLAADAWQLRTVVLPRDVDL